MCNLYTQSKSVDEVARLFKELQMPLRFPDGIPNLEPRDIAITDPGPIVRVGGGKFELIVRRWSWPGPGGKPVFNFRSDGREFGSGRCLILADAFYEFTKPDDPKAKRKHKWRFALRDASTFAIAGLWRTDPAVGEAFTMLTCPPGEDIAPYHNRQVALLAPADFAAWLDPQVPARDLLQPLPGGSLAVEQVG
jgi:putative SOS response-associated peptidase YedK